MPLTSRLRALIDAAGGWGPCVSLVTSAGLGAIVLTLAVVRNVDNRRAETAEREAIEAAVSSDLRAMARQLTVLADDEPMAIWMAPNSLNYQLDQGYWQRLDRTAFDQIFAVDLHTKAPLQASPATAVSEDIVRFVTVMEPALERLQTRAHGDAVPDLLRSDQSLRPSHGGETSLFALGPVAYEGAVVPLVRQPATSAVANANRFALVGIRHVGQDFIKRIERAAEVGRIDLRLGSEVLPAESTLTLDRAGDEGPLVLAWRSARPGDALAIQLGSFLIGFTALFSAFVVFRSQRLVRDVAASEARAVAFAAQDPLTGLANRLKLGALLDRELARVARTREGCALLYLDLDRFKDINDTFGHDAGDAVLIEAVRRIKSVMRAGDELARFGGDEFALLQTGVAAPSDCEMLARRIIEALQQPFQLGDSRVAVGASIGIAMAPRDASERNEMMRLADMALYRAKNSGRGRFAFFEERMSDELRLRKSVEDELRHAIDNDGLCVHYQPIMTADGGQIKAVEALVRWRHPVKGLIPPDNFIRLAEDGGLIVPLGEWVLRRAIADARNWPLVRVAVNVSPIQFRNPGFVEMVERVLIAERFEPGRLELELTEGVLVDDADQAENAILELRGLGVRVALDDFGTGYSSLIYLRRFAFDKIKIDKSFLESTETTGESAIILHSIVHLGRALGLTVTAEGVETPEQLRFLQALGCHEMQGFMFSKPLPVEEAEAFIYARQHDIRAVA